MKEEIMQKYPNGSVFIARQKGASDVKIVIDCYDDKESKILCYAVNAFDTNGKSFGHIIYVSEAFLNNCICIQ